MDEARLGPDDLGEMGQEGDDVVLGHRARSRRCASTSKTASLRLGPDRRAASFGTTPSSASAVVAWASISNQMRKQVCGSQMAHQGQG